MAHGGIKPKELYEISYCECSSISDICIYLIPAAALRRAKNIC